MTSKKLPSLSETHKLPPVLPSVESYKHYLEAVCNNATVALFIMDEQQHCVYMNAAAERLTGYTLSEVQGRALHNVIHHTRPDGRPYPLCECPIDQAFPQNNQEQGEEVFVHKDGHFYPVAYTASPIREASGVVGTVIEVRDITQEKRNETERREATEALRQSEERFRQFSENAKDVFWITDLKTPRLLYINSTYETIWQRSRESLYQNYNWLETIHPDDRDRVQAASREAFTKGYEIEYRIVRPNGSIRWIRDRGFPLPELEGEPYRMAGIAEDITDRKSAEFERQRLITLIDNSEDFIGIATLDGQAVYLNPAGQLLVGLDGLEAVRQTQVLDYFLPDDRADVQEVILPYLLQHGSWRGEAQFRHFQTGAAIPVDYSLFVVNDPQTHEPIALGTVTRDITRQKQVENERQQAEQEREQLLQQVEANLRQLEAIVNTMSEGLIVADPQGNILSFNPAALALHGYNRLEEVQQHFSQFPQIVDVRDTDGNPVPLEEWALSRVLRGEIVSNYELTIRRRNTGKTFVGSYSGSPVYDAEGNLILAIVTVRDITAQKQIQADLARSEAKFRQMTDLLPQIMWTADPDGTIDYYSQQWENYTGLSRTAMTESDWQIVMPPEDRRRTVELWAEAVQKEQSLYECEHRIRSRSGEYRWHLSRAVPYRDEQGNLMKWFGLTIDIHEQKLAMDARSNALLREQAAREEAEQANRVKDEFLAVLSHELRTPLNPILGWTRLLRTGKLDAVKTRDALAAIDRNAQLQAQLIEDLLDISRILRKKLSLNLVEVPLIVPVESALETVQLAAEAKQIQIETHLEATDAIVLGDESRLQQVVSNLLTNAVKFTPVGGRVEVKLEQVEGKAGEQGSNLPTHPSIHPPRFAQITVTDTGKGISPDFLPHIFEHFRQEDSSTTRKFGGLGLGLAIVRQLVDLQGGTVEAQSPGEGQGATFIVKLPLVEQGRPEGWKAGKTSEDTGSEDTESSAASQTPNSPTPLVTPPQRLHGLRVLFVDDERDSLEFVRFVLEQEGAIVQTATSGAEAIAQLPDFAPDVLLSDVGMPQMDGYGLMRQIRRSAQGQTIPAIALTAYAGELDQQRALEAGFQKHIAKPIDPTLLIHTIYTLCSDSLSTR